MERFVGKAQNLLLKDVNVTNTDGYTGVLGGLVNSPIKDRKAEITKVGITGTVNSTNSSIGGFFGGVWGETCSFDNCYSRVSLNGGGYYDQGGFIYEINSSDSNVNFNNCYVAGTFSAKDRVGPYYGRNLYGNSKLTNCYYNSDLCTPSLWEGVNKDTVGTALSTNAFRNKDNFQGWDFENTWYIDEETGYPELKFDNM